MAGRPCKSECECRKHFRLPEHNVRISMSVRLTYEAKGLSMEPKRIKQRIKARKH